MESDESMILHTVVGSFHIGWLVFQIAELNVKLNRVQIQVCGQANLAEILVSSKERRARQCRLNGKFSNMVVPIGLIFLRRKRKDCTERAKARTIAESLSKERRTVGLITCQCYAKQHMHGQRKSMPSVHLYPFGMTLTGACIRERRND